MDWGHLVHLKVDMCIRLQKKYTNSYANKCWTVLRFAGLIDTYLEH